jgi:hypothetical protein
MAAKTRLAWFSPLYKNQDDKVISASGLSRAAYTSYYLIPELAPDLSIDLFYRGPSIEILLNNKFKITANNYLNAANKGPYDLYVYHLEDSPCNGWVRHHLGLKPGLVWYHDILFQSRPPDPLSHSPWQYVVEALKQVQNITLPDYDVWPETNDPYPWRESNLCLGAIFSSPWAHGEFRRRVDMQGLVPSALNESTPTTFLPSIMPPLSRVLSHKTEKVGILGSINNEDRVCKILSALDDDIALIWYVSPNDFEGVERFLNNLYPDRRVVIEKYENIDHLRELIAKTSLVFILHYSLYGNIWPLIEICRQTGSLCAISDHGIAEYISDNEVFKIPVGNEEVWYIREIVNIWQKGIVTEAEPLIGEQGNLEYIAKEFLFFLRDNQAVFDNGAKAWNRIEQWSLDWLDRQLLDMTGGEG